MSVELRDSWVPPVAGVFGMINLGVGMNASFIGAIIGVFFGAIVQYGVSRFY